MFCIMKIMVGVVASIFMPVTLVSGIVAAPFYIAHRIKGRIAARKKKGTTREYYQGYIDGDTSNLPQLMAQETEDCIKHLAEGETVKSAIG